MAYVVLYSSNEIWSSPVKFIMRLCDNLETVPPSLRVPRQNVFTSHSTVGNAGCLPLRSGRG